MQKTIAASAVVLGVLLTTGAPAIAQNREHQQLAAELRMLQEQNQQLSLALAQLTEALKAVNGRLDANEQYQQRRFADQETLVKNVGADLSAIRERTQETDRRMRSLTDEIEALRKTFLTLPDLITQALTPIAPVDPTATTPSPDGATPAPAPAPISAPRLPLPSTAGLSPNHMYDTAFSDYTAGLYSLAITGLEQLVSAFPQAERADDAQYLIGESLYGLNRFAEAATAYNLVIEKYPSGDQVDMAFYKRGLSQERAGDAEAAKASWEAVVKRYPESQGAGFARQSLVRLSRQTPPAASAPRP